MLHLFVDILRNSILITGLVAVMMMMIESLNIESRGMFFTGLRRTKVGQVVIAALLGSVPGCMGGFATVSLYTHRMFSFGALIAMMIASSGDEAFMMIAMIPDKALAIFAALFVIAVIAGVAVDMIHDRIHGRRCSRTDHSGCGIPSSCRAGYAVHETDGADHGVPCHGAQEIESSHHGDGCRKDNVHGKSIHKRHFGWKRITMFLGLAVFIAALATGKLSHDHNAHAAAGHEACIHTENVCCTEHEAHSHSHGTCSGHEHGHGHSHGNGNEFGIDLLSEDWMNVLFAGLSLIVLFVLALGSDHFVEEHIWNHIVKKHIPTIFAWTFGVLLILGIGLRHFDISTWISGNTALMVLLAAAVGIIPESGPHIIFVTLYAAGVIPVPVLLASCISQDGHASLPLLAESKKSFFWAKLINCVLAIAVGYAAMLLL